MFSGSRFKEQEARPSFGEREMKGWKCLQVFGKSARRVGSASIFWAQQDEKMAFVFSGSCPEKVEAIHVFRRCLTMSSSWGR